MQSTSGFIISDRIPVKMELRDRFGQLAARRKRLRPNMKMAFTKTLQGIAKPMTLITIGLGNSSTMRGMEH
jgi:hypothetical protein